MRISRIIFLLLLMLSLASCKNKEPEPDIKKQKSEEEHPQKRLMDAKIEVENPQPGEEINSPYIITGKARGNWFFEANFPIYLIDEENNEIAVAIATAQEDWMTEDFVIFKAELIFEKPQLKKAFLRFQKANPSGKPEFEEYIRIPVTLEAGETMKME